MSDRNDIPSQGIPDSFDTLTLEPERQYQFIVGEKEPGDYEVSTSSRGSYRTYEEAKEALDNISESFKLYKEALQAFWDDDKELAKQKCQQAVEKDPQYEECRRLLYRLEQDSGEP